MWPDFLLSTFRVAERPTVNFHQCFVRLRRLLSTFVSFPCGRETFRQLPSILGPTFVNFQFGRENFRKFSLNFHAARIPSVNFPCIRKTFCQLPLTFREAVSPVNFSLSWCGLENFRELPSSSVRQRDLSSTSVNFPCDQETFRQLPSTFHASRTTSVNFPCGQETFHQLSLTIRVEGRLPSTLVQM